MNDPTLAARRWHIVSLLGYFSLFSLLMLWNTVLAGSPRVPVAIMLLITVTPLLIPLRGFLHGRPKSCAWMAYVSLLYLVHGILEAYSAPDTRFYAMLEILFSLLIFFGATYYVRYSARARAA